MSIDTLADDFPPPDFSDYGTEVLEEREFVLFPPKRTKKQMIKEFFYLLKKPTPPSTDLLSPDGAMSGLLGFLGGATAHYFYPNIYLSILAGFISFYIPNKICRTINYLLVEREDDPYRYFDDGILSKGF